MLSRKKIFTSLFFSLFIFSNIFSSGFITHVYFAQKYLEKCPNYTEEQKKDFIIGTLFPDIRFLTGMPREQTHERNATLDDVKNAKTAFVAGKKFHSFVDYHRKDFVYGHEIYKKLHSYFLEKDYPIIKRDVVCLLEDVILEEKTDLKKIKNFFDEIHPEELEVKDSIVSNWHKALKVWLGTGQNRVLQRVDKASKLWESFTPSESVSKYFKFVVEYKDKIEELSKKDFVKEYVDDYIKFYDKAFEKIISC